MNLATLARRVRALLLGPFLLVAAAGSVAGSGERAASRDTLERAVDRLFARWNRPGSPGAGVGVVRNGRVAYAAGYGSAHLEWGSPITSSTVFHVASLSKQFTAFAVALLAERGALSLDDDVRQYLPWVPDFGSPITLGHLLYHTSGLRDQWTLLRMAGRRLDDVITQEDVLQLVRRQKELNFQPGKEFLYSNTGYTLLAEVVEVVAGRAFGGWMRETVFEALGMSRTRFQEDHERVVNGRAESFERRPDARARSGGFRHRALNLSTVGATGLLTTVEDLARWVAFLDDPGSAAGRIPGAPGAVRRMEVPGTLSDGTTIGYALGQAIGRYRGLRTVAHGGGDAGFRSHLLRFPDERFAVVVLANTPEIDAGRLARRVAGLYLEQSLEPVGTPNSGTVPEATGPHIPAPEAAAPTHDLDLERLERFVGRYWSPATGDIREVRVVEGRLRYARGFGRGLDLVPLGEGRFRLATRSGDERLAAPTEVRFQPRNGRPEHLLVLGAGGLPTVYRAVEPWNPTAAELREYQGEYWSDELGILYSLRSGDGILRLRHPRDGELPLTPAVPDAFTSLQPWLARVRFLRDRDGSVAGFRASGPRVRELLFVRLQ